MPQFSGRLSDQMVLAQGIDGQSGLPTCEIPIPLPANLLAQFVDSALVVVPQRLKTLVLVVTSAVTSAAAQQGTVQLFAARTPFANPATGGSGPSGQFLGASGATSGFPTTGQNAASAVGPIVNFGGSVTSLPVQPYWFSSTSPGNPSASPPTSMTELTQWYPALGVEIHFPGAPTGGSYTLFFELAAI